MRVSSSCGRTKPLCTPGFSDVGELIGQIEPGKTVDLVQAFAFPLPVQAVSEILGIPSAPSQATPA